MIGEWAGNFKFLKSTLVFPWLFKLAKRSRKKPNMRFNVVLIDDNRYDSVVEGVDEGEFYDIRWLWADNSDLWGKLDRDFNLYPDDCDATYSLITNGRRDFYGYRKP